MIWLRRFLLIGLMASIVLATAYFWLDSTQGQLEMDTAARAAAPGKFVELSDGVTHYLDEGPADGPVILFIHGGGITGAEVWRNNIPYLAEQGFRVISYDLYGRGYSDRIDGRYTPKLMVDQVKALIDNLGISKISGIVSMSMGSMIAIEYIARHQPEVGKLVLIDPAATGDFKPNLLLRIPIISNLLMTFYWYPKAIEGQRKEFVDQVLFEDYSLRLRHFMQYEGYKRMTHSTWTNTLNQERLTMLKTIGGQELLLICGLEDPYFPAGNLDRYKEAAPSVQIVQVPEAGHMPHYERPDDVNPVLVDFLAERVPAPLSSPQ
jgi:pimeloyl-ACP methyl ester carboxylesterase